MNHLVRTGPRRGTGRISRGAVKTIVALYQSGMGGDRIAAEMRRRGFRAPRPATSAEERACVFAALRQNQGNVKRTARETGVPEATVRRWRNESEDTPSAPCNPIDQGARWDGAFVEGVLRRAAVYVGQRERPMADRELVRHTLLANGGNVRRTARETGLAQSTVQRCRNEFGIEPYDPSPKDPWERDAQQQESFWARVDKSSGRGGCWLWTVRVDKKGYGRVFQTTAHRFAFESVHGPIGVRHLHHVCATPGCVNPAHLLPVAGPSEHARLDKLEKAFIAEMLAANATAPRG